MRPGGARQLERTGQVGREQRVEPRACQLRGRYFLELRSVADQRVQSAVRVHRLRHDALRIAVASLIALDQRRAHSQRPDLLRGLVRLRGRAAVVHHDVRAGFRECAGDGPADTHRAARDEHRAAAPAVMRLLHRPRA